MSAAARTTERTPSGPSGTPLGLFALTLRHAAACAKARLWPWIGLAWSGGVRGVVLCRRGGGLRTVLAPSPEPAGEHDRAENVQRRNHPARAARSLALGRARLRVALVPG
jgi:hypothetical protein